MAKPINTMADMMFAIVRHVHVQKDGVYIVFQDDSLYHIQEDPNGEGAHTTSWDPGTWAGVPIEKVN